jgi:hypothetical protein
MDKNPPIVSFFIKMWHNKKLTIPAMGIWRKNGKKT